MLSITASGCSACLTKGIVVAGVDTVDSVQDVCCVSNSARKNPNGVLMFALWNDAAEFRSEFSFVKNTEDARVYPALDVKPTVGLMPTIAFRSAGLITTGSTSSASPTKLTPTYRFHLFRSQGQT